MVCSLSSMNLEYYLKEFPAQWGGNHNFLLYATTVLRMTKVTIAPVLLIGFIVLIAKKVDVLTGKKDVAMGSWAPRRNKESIRKEKRESPIWKRLLIIFIFLMALMLSIWHFIIVLLQVVDHSYREEKKYVHNISSSPVVHIGFSPLSLLDSISQWIDIVEMIMFLVKHTCVLSVLYWYYRVVRIRWNNIHTVFEIFAFYCILSFVPSQNSWKYGLTSGESFKTGIYVFVWSCTTLSMATLLLLIARLVLNAKSSMKDFRRLKVVFFAKENVLSTLYVLSSILGIIASIGIVYSCFFPWFNISHMSKTNLDSFFMEHRELRVNISNVIHVVEEFDCINISAPKLHEFRQVRKKFHTCFTHREIEDRTCDLVTEAFFTNTMVVNTTYESCEPTMDECSAIKSLEESTRILFDDVFANKAAELLDRTAAIMKKTNTLLKLLGKTKDVAGSLYTQLDEMSKYTKRESNDVKFTFTKSFTYLIILPPLIDGVMAVTMAFWKLVYLKKEMSRLILVLIVCNASALTLAQLATTIAQVIWADMPLVYLNITEGEGWKFIKISTICSTMSLCLAWLYLIASPSKWNYVWRLNVAESSSSESEIQELKMSSLDELEDHDDNVSAEYTPECPKGVLPARAWGIALPVVLVAFALIVVGVMHRDFPVITLAFSLNYVFHGHVIKAKGQMTHFASVAEQLIDESKRCESALLSIRQMFEPVFNVLSNGIIDQTNNYITSANHAFVNFQEIEFLIFRWLFLVPPIVAIGAFALAFFLTLFSKTSYAKQVKYMIYFFLGVMAVTLMVHMIITYSVVCSINVFTEYTSLLNETIKYGPVVYLSVASTVLLSMGYLLLWI